MPVTSSVTFCFEGRKEGTWNQWSWAVSCARLGKEQQHNTVVPRSSSIIS